ncbi:hypothetical protein D3C75_1011770 [compost metagenome]
MAEVLIGIDAGKQHQPKGKHAGEDDPHHRIFLYPAVFFQIARRDRAENTGKKCANRQWNAEHKGQHNAGKHGVRNGIPHQ